MSQEPTKNAAVAAVYAVALYDAAVNAGVIDDVVSDIAALLDLSRNSPAVVEFLRSPSIGSEQKLRVLESSFGGYLNALTLSTLRSMAHRDRLDLFSEFIAQMESLHRNRRGHMPVEARSPVPLSADQVRSIEQALSEKYKSQVTLNVVVHPNLIGGIQLKIGDTFVDGSVRQKLFDMGRLIRHRVLTDVAADSQRMVLT
jgi:F-type H+-transporting ATPase subunit delta